jgi:Tol biopolymer transport system component
VLQGGGGNAPPPNPEIAYLDKGIRVMNADGTNKVLVIANVGSGSGLSDPAWSPDGQELVFTGTFDAIRGIWRVRLDGTERRLVTPLTGGTAWRPKWSPTPAPDGQPKIVFTDSELAGDKDVYSVNLDGSERQNLTSSPAVYEFDVAWAGDGTRLVVSRNHTLVLLELAASGGSIAVVSETLVYAKPGGASGFPPMQMCWANTREALAFCESDSASIGLNIKLLDVTALPATPYPLLVPNPSGDERWPSFSPDDSRLAYHNGGIWVVNANGSGKVKISKSGSQPSWRP